MEALTIIQSVEQAGYELMADGEHIRIKNGKRLPDSLKASIRDYKRDILASLTRDKQAQKAGLMIGIPGVLYTVTISKVSSVYMERIDSHWEAWREVHYAEQIKAISAKTIASGSTFEYVLQKVKRYLHYIEQKRG